MPSAVNMATNILIYLLLFLVCVNSELTSEEKEFLKIILKNIPEPGKLSKLFYFNNLFLFQDRLDSIKEYSVLIFT